MILLVNMALITQKACMAQENADFDLERFVENLFSLQELDIDYADFYESLLLLYQNPVDINTASVDQLKNTYVLSNLQIINLHRYIEQKGKLITLYELQVIEGFDFETIQNLLPFISINSRDATSDLRPLLQRILSEKNNYFISRYERILETKQGYKPPQQPDQNHYAGTQPKLYLRYRVSKPGDFSFGFTTEKDPGEAFVFDKNTRRLGMDFWSAHAMLEHKGKIRKFIIGDYQMQFGQGLLLGSGLSVGKGSETINTVQRVSLGIRPYSSVLESGFLRGAAATYEFDQKTSLTGFVSQLRVDANVQENETETADFFSSIQTSGLHRTPTEIRNKHQVKEHTYGLNLSYKPDRDLSFGMTLLFNQFDIPIKQDRKPYRIFEFEGAKNINAGLFASYNWQGFTFFTESAISRSGGVGWVGGLTKNISPRLVFALVARNYGRNFHSFRGTAFGENSRNINEQGVYWGIKYTLNRKFFLTSYYDSYHFPWLKFRVNTPSHGHDFLVRLNYNPGNSVAFYGQIRSETKEINFTPEGNQVRVIPGTKNQHVLNLEFKPIPDLRLKTRVQWSTYTLDHQKTRGVAFIQDAGFRIGKWNLNGRSAFFDTNGAENRQYAYERDVLYAFSIPAYSGRGIRNYLLIQYNFGRKTDIWIRVARTTFYDRQKIGTGLETIDGDKRTEVKFQMRYKLK